MNVGAAFLIALMFTSAFAVQSTSTVKPFADSYVVADISNPYDQFGLRNLNFGGSPVMDVGYTQDSSANTTVLSATFIGFDLASIRPLSVANATLQVYVNATSSNSSAPIHLRIFLAAPVTWNESAIDYNNAPRLVRSIANVTVTSSGEYSWDVSAAFKNRTSTIVSFALAPAQVKQGGDEHVIFNSKEARSNGPSLAVTYEQGGIPLTYYIVLAAAIGAAAVVGFLYFRSSRGGKGANAVSGPAGS